MTEYDLLSVSFSVSLVGKKDAGSGFVFSGSRPMVVSPAAVQRLHRTHGPAADLSGAGGCCINLFVEPQSGVRPGDTPPSAQLERLIFAPFSSPAVIVAEAGKSADVLRCIQMRRGRAGGRAEGFSPLKRPMVQTRRHLSETKRGEAETFYQRASNINLELLLSSPYFFFFHSQSAPLLAQTAIYVLHLGGMGTVMPGREQKWLRTFRNAQVKGFQFVAKYT